MRNFPFLPILALIFITLKLLGVIAWSWLWVLAPIWLPLGLIAVAFIGLVVLTMIAEHNSV
jgi:hypothetical protein